MSFQPVFVVVAIGFSLIVAAFLINRARPGVETSNPPLDFVRASGKCAACRVRLQCSVVNEYELSTHARKRVNCIDYHQPSSGQDKLDHHGFVIAKHLTAGNCRSCHEQEYLEFLLGRHAGPSWGAVGEKALTAEQVRYRGGKSPKRSHRELLGLMDELN